MTELGPPPNQHERVGSVLAHTYPLERVVGGDGLAAVFASRSPEDGRPVWVRVLDDSLYDHEDVTGAFLEGARRCQRLVHPNIARVLDVGTEEGGAFFMVMDAYDGARLVDYTGSGVRVPLGQAAAILQGILAGLGAAHAHGVVHRELTPASVVLAREPSGSFTPKIVDFGLGDLLSAARTGACALHASVKGRTKAYASPEQLGAAQTVDARSDLWSAGVILYEMLTGRPAFAAPTEFALLMAIFKERPLPVEQIDPGLARVSAFLRRALEKDPGSRFPSALEMARALAAAAGNDTTGTVGGLPDVPSLWMPPPGGAARAGATGAAPATAPAPAPPGSAAPPTQGSGGTLASFAVPPVAERRPRVEVAVVGTLPSEDLPVLPARGGRSVSTRAVALLVAVALAVGFGLGLATATILSSELFR